MTLKSALEDLSSTTLHAISGCLRRLEYVAGLRAEKGEYAHWGFNRVYGETTAKTALVAAHKEAVSEVLCTPLRELLEDVERSTGSSGIEAEHYLQTLAQKDTALLPSNPGAGSARHLKSVLHALLGLERLRDRERDATRRVS